MQSEIALRVDGVSKLYRLGQVGTGTISHDLNRWWHQVRGKEDPYAKVGQENLRDKTNSTPESANATEYVWALRGIDLEVKRGEILGIIGRNGAGKSTLLKLLSRVTAPTDGEIRTRGRMASLLEVGTGFHQELTGRENIFLNGAILGMRRSEISKQLDAITEFSGCAKYLDTPVKRYSSGMTVRLGFAVAAHLHCDTLIVDEVLAVGDAEFQKMCIGKMKEISSGEGRTVLFVSHNMGSISQLCSRAALLNAGSIELVGEPDECIASYLASRSGLSPSEFIPKRQCSDFALEKISIVNDQGLLQSNFPWDSAVRLLIEFDNSENLSGVDIGVRVKDRRGISVFVTSMAESIRSDLYGGKGTLCVKLPGEFLMPGTYTVSVNAHIPNARLLSSASDAVQLTLEETGSPFARHSGADVGLVHAECAWGVEGCES